MTGFRDLLKPDPQSEPNFANPGLEQKRASKGLAKAVEQSNLRWWKSHKLPIMENYLVLLVAPYSQYDLVLLDILDEKMDRECPPVPIYVVNLLAYETLEHVARDFPGIKHVLQTPIAVLYESGQLTQVAWGSNARGLAAKVIGMTSEELNRRVIDESPSYANPGLV